MKFFKILLCLLILYPNSLLAQSTTPFTTFTFPATGEPTSRTMPNRLAEVRNVLDFGATGDGSTDDTNAIQAAINAENTTAVTTASSIAGSTTVTFSGGVPAKVQANPAYYSIIDNTTSAATGGGLHVISATTTTITLAVSSPVLSPGIGSSDSISFYSSFRGKIFFPPGRYKVTAPLTVNLPGGDFSIVFEGVGDLSTIFGNVNGFIIDRITTPYSVGGGVIVITRLKIINGALLGGGIRMGSTTGTSVEDNTINADIGFTTTQSQNNIDFTAYSQNVKGNRFAAATSPIATGSTAITLTNNSTSIDNDISGYDIGTKLFGTAVSIIGGRSEVNNTGILIGVYPDGSGHALSGFLIAGGSFESNIVAVDFAGSGGGYGTVTGLAISGFTGAGPGGANPAYGIRCAVQKCNNVVFQGIRINGTLTGAGFSLGDNPNRGYNVIQGVESVSWSMPTTAGTGTFIASNNPAPIYAFSTLPISPITIGETYIISNASTGNCSDAACNWGANVTSGGGALQRSVQWNGANWTVLSK